MDGLRWALIELLGFIVLIALARLAAIHEAAKHGAAKPSELEGLIGERRARADTPDSQPADAQGLLGGVSLGANCWPAKGRGRGGYSPHARSGRERETDPEALDE